MILITISHWLYHPTPANNNAFPVEVAETTTTTTKKQAADPPLTSLFPTANLKRGAKIFKKCAACHSVEKGGASKVGPALWGIINATKGHVSGFSYSKALLKMGGGWSFDELNAFLKKPRSYIKGTKMNFIGLKKPQDRADILLYLRSLDDTPAKLPQ
ncbi:MAG: c-type cytochrome [Parvibaculales bacterium]